MAKGITHSCAHIWRHIARAGGWWSLLRVSREWEGVFSMDEIAEHLATLKRGGFLAAMDYVREGTVYAYTPQCRQLPGETLVPVTTGGREAVEPIAAPRREVMTGTYVPPSMPTCRLGSLDHIRHPSLLQGKRSYRSTAA